MDTVLAILSGLGIGATLGALMVAHYVTHSTILRPPPRGSGRLAHIGRTGLRLPFFLASVLSLTLARPLYLLFGISIVEPLSAILGFVFLFYVGAAHVVPAFIKVKVYSE